MLMLAKKYTPKPVVKKKKKTDVDADPRYFYKILALDPAGDDKIVEYDVDLPKKNIYYISFFFF